MTDTPDHADFWGDPIHTYTREQAIADGTLVHVKTLGRGQEAVTVCFTSALYADVPNESRRDMLILEGCMALARSDPEDTESMKLRTLRDETIWVILDGDGLTFLYPSDY